MKKLAIIGGILLFFTLTAMSISFTSWTWINEDAYAQNAGECIGKKGFIVTQERRTENGIPQIRSMCACFEGYRYDHVADRCIKVESE